MLRLERAAYLLTLLLATTTAQVLTTGNGQLPACAQTCSNLVRASQACGGNAGTSQTIWSCFCQSAYLTPFENNPAGVCTDTCTSASDNQNVMQWYKTNCGSDYGASEHANAGAAGTTTTTSTSTSAAAGGQQTASSATTSATSTSGSDVQGQEAAQTQQDGSWWSTHYKWVIMLIVLFIGLLGLALLAIWLKKRHERKQDQIKSSFNEGITTRSAPATLDSPMKQVEPTVSGPYAQSGSVLESGRNSPARTRDAFMPYGYGYARSESRLGNNLPEDAIQRAGSPLAQTQVPEEEGGAANKSAEAGKRRRVLVRERSVGGENK